jgi:hypothetical protein
MARFQELIALLNHATADPRHLPSAIEQFQTAVWNSTDQQLGGSDQVRQVLRALAHELDYYVADPEARAEDAAYYDEGRAVREILAALTTIRR